MASRAPDATPGLEPQRVVWTLRAVLLLVCVLAALPQHRALPALAAAVVIVLLAAAARWLPPASVGPRLLGIGEAVVAGVAVALTGFATSPFLLYLTVPALAAGLLAGAVDAIVVAVLGAAVLLGVAAVGGELTDRLYLTSTGEIVALALAVGLVAAWSRRLFRLSQTGDQPAYTAAYRLLTQLRAVTRQLPGTLDPVTVTGQLLDELARIAPYDRAGVFIRTGRGRLAPLAGGAEVLNHWDVSLTDDSPFAEAWASQEVQRVARAGRPWLVVLPLLVGVRTCGLVALEGDDGAAPSDGDLATLRSVAGDLALRLETALLFDDVRDLATAEERSRLAREIHDGIAQELVIVGYGIDNALGELPPGADATRESLEALRGEVTRVISELRLSLFDLRSDIEPHGGLGAAISAYLRNAGTVADLTIHLRLNESPHRLSASVEVELLRIVQEAVTNARKHAHARNLWVSCDIEPPHARVLIEDDGRGLTGEGRSDSFGLSVMRERAERIRATLEVRPRADGGTRVEVRLGAPTTPSTLAASERSGERVRADRSARR